MVQRKRDTYVDQVEKVFTSYYGLLCYFAFRYVHNDEVARDIVQDVFVVLMEKKQDFQSEVHLRNFLYLSVKNHCLNYLRSRLSREHYITYLKREGNEEEFDCRVMEAEIYQKLNQAVEMLPAECRKVFELYFFKGMDNETVARTLQVSIHTVKAQKKRGKQILRKNLQGWFPLLLLLLEV